MEIGRRCFGCSSPRTAVLAVRPKKASPSSMLPAERSVARPTSMRPRMKGPCGTPGGGGGGLGSTPFCASFSVSSRRRSWSGAWPLKLTSAPALRARATNSCSAQAPERSRRVRPVASMSTRRAPFRSRPSSSASTAPNSCAPHSPLKASSMPSLVRRTSTAMWVNFRGRPEDLRLALGVQVGLEEPEVLVDLARDTGEEVGGVGVTEPGRFGDGRAYLGAEGGEHARQGLHVRHPFGDRRGVRLEGGGARDLGERAVRDAPERGGTLGDGVDLVLDRLGELVEQLVQGDEVGALDVPVRVLHLGAKIDRIGQALVEELHHLGAGGEGEIVAGLEHVASS